jgi:hypothetical protein
MVFASPEVEAQQTADASPPAHVVVVVQGGKAEFRRPEWKLSAPARFGTVLRAGDVISLEPAASAVIVCSGFSRVVSVTGTGAKPVPCSTTRSRKIWEWDGDQVLPTAQIQLPHASDLWTRGQTAVTFEDDPALTWPELPGAEAYEITVRGPGVTWTSTTFLNKLEYPTDAPKLLFNREYEVNVHAKKGRDLLGSMDGFVNMKVAVVNRPTARVLAGTVDDTKKLKLPTPVVSFLAAKVMAIAGQYDSAIKALQSLRSLLDEPAVVRELGDAYAASGSLSNAEASLAEASRLFEKSGDIVGRALAEEALAKIESTGQKRSAAADRLRVALAIYQQLGDTSEATRIEGLLKSLNQLSSVRAK